MQVKVLNDQEFEALPYPEMSTSIGVADPQTRTAYVRKTHVPIIDAFTIAHELEHLQDGERGVHADHYRNGVYYKGFGDIAKTGAVIGANFIPGIGPLVSAGLGTGFSAIEGRKQRKRAGVFDSVRQIGESFQQPQQTPMEQFQPQPSHPNVVQVGGQISESGGFGGGINESTIQKIRGHFSGRNPQERF